MAQKSLAEKLGIKQNMKICVLNPPENYFAALGSLSKNIIFVKALQCPIDLVHCFTRKREELEEAFPVVKAALSPNGMLWVSWPKKSAVSN